MSYFILHVGFAIALIAAVLLLNGKMAEWTYREYNHSRFNWLFLGGITELKALKTYYRILGVVTLVVATVVYVGAVTHW